MPSENEKASCKRKTRYATEHDAKKSVEYLRDKRGVRKTMRTYKCPVCFGYHLSSSAKK